jgi:V/A-type H+-transporting ATPase subunit D
MAKIKHTKNELKGQRDALKRYRRYLPTLQLKKQQLQAELRSADHRIEETAAKASAARKEAAGWVRLFAEPFDFAAHLRVERVDTTTSSVAGVTFPVLRDVVFARSEPELMTTPPWVDEGLRLLELLLRLDVERSVLEEQRAVLAAELRTTSQRVNLFEKIKIPEAEDNIRVIRVFLGDLQTADVARAKIAKGKATAEVSG